jgi:DNA invertase Pin-like site-specific DNA recombinase
MEFNTLDAQRESCAAYITSQRAEGWIASTERYDDGGFSGGSLERPALKKLLEDIGNKKVHIVAVYKIDRLTRSLMDFAKLVQVFDEHGVTFVSITQSFNTTTSMGRLTLNVLLSFAQFEREVAGERIRDKIAASKAKGMWMGGVAPVGYKIEHRQLVVNPDEMKLTRHIFDRYLALGSVRALKEELDRAGIKGPARKSLAGKPYGGCAFSRGKLYWILKNPAYIGKISHKGKIHEGLHEDIIPPDIWQRVQQHLNDQSIERTENSQRRCMLQGLIYDMEGTLYSPAYTSRHNRQYCYYVSQNTLHDRNHPQGTMKRLPGHELEMVVEKALRNEIRRLAGEEDEAALAHILTNHKIIPTHHLVRSCVEKITIARDQLTITVKTAGFYKLVETHMNLKMSPYSDTFEIAVPLKVGRAKRGAIILKPEGQDIFDIPSVKLKKVVQGFIWREEHFAGMALKDIARRERYSEGYVGTAIFESFEFGKAAS